MKKLFFVLTLVSVHIYCLESPQTLPTTPNTQPVSSDTNNILTLPEGIKTVHIHNQNIVENNNMPKFLINMYNNTSLTVTTVLQRAQEKFNYHLQWLIETLTKHKKITALGAGVSSYLGLWTYLYYLQNQTYMHNAWSSWKGHVPLQVLINSSQDEIAKELVIDIQKKYTSTEHLADFISPLVQFINTITTEKKLLERYLFLQKWLSRFYVHYIFPHDQTAIAKAQEKVARLAYLKQLLISWISEYKIQTTNTKSAENEKGESCDTL